MNSKYIYSGSFLLTHWKLNLSVTCPFLPICSWKAE